MSSSTIASLLTANQKIIIYGGIPTLISGLGGALLNTIVFLSLKTFRQSSCAFYLTILSIANIVQLLTGLLTRIMISGFGIDWSNISLFYCKFRTFAFQTTVMISFSCICLATIDQYFATCIRPRWQQWSNIKLARRMVLFAILFAIFEQSPCLIFYNHIQLPKTNITTCTTTSDTFVQFNAYFNYLVVGNLVPYIITFSFGFMAYRNTQEITYRTVPLVRRELDKQLTVMVLVQVTYMSITVFPNTFFYLILSYGNIQNENILAQVRLVYAVTTCLYYTCFASPFYIYMCVSERFRRQFIYVFFKIDLRQYRRKKISPELHVFSI